MRLVNSIWLYLSFFPFFLASFILLFCFRCSAEIYVWLYVSHTCRFFLGNSHLVVLCYGQPNQTRIENELRIAIEAYLLGCVPCARHAIRLCGAPSTFSFSAIVHNHWSCCCFSWFIDFVRERKTGMSAVQANIQKKCTHNNSNRETLFYFDYFRRMRTIHSLLC